MIFLDQWHKKIYTQEEVLGIKRRHFGAMDILNPPPAKTRTNIDRRIDFVTLGNWNPKKTENLVFCKGSFC